MRLWLAPIGIFAAIVSMVLVRAWACQPSRWPPRDLPEPTSAQVAQLRARLEGKLRATERPVAHIELDAMWSDDRRVSKVGGAPYLPRGSKVPKDVSGREMALLAQVNFAEVGLAGFPSQGIFQLYISPQGPGVYGVDLDRLGTEAARQQRFFRAVYWPAPLAEELESASAYRQGGNLPHDPLRPQRMRFRLGTEPISPLDTDFEAKIGVNPFDFVADGAARLGVDEGALAAALFESGAGHKLGGYPYFTQYDPRPPGGPERLLLQLDSEDGAGLLWGDGGVANLFVVPEDLEDADFSRVLWTWDCH